MMRPRLPLLAAAVAALLLLRAATVRGATSWPPCAGPAPPPGGVANITDVHLVMMNHLDVGFGEQNGTQAGYINNVLNEYFEVSGGRLGLPLQICPPAAG